MSKNKKIPSIFLEAAIKQVFGDLKTAAKYFEMSPSNFSNKLKRQTEKFLELLSSGGVNIPKEDEYKMNFNIHDPNKEYDSDKVIKLEKEIAELRALVIAQAKQNAELQKEMEFWRGNAAKSGKLPPQRPEMNG